MKKLLLNIAIIINMTASAQNFWTEVGNIFSDPTYITGEISIVDNNVIWVNGRPGNNTGSSQDKRRQWSKSNDGGLTWTEGNYNFLPSLPQAVVGSIAAISIDIAYISTYSAFGNNDSPQIGVFKTIDGGNTWVKQTSADFSNPNSFANFVHFYDGDNGIVIGDPVGGNYQIYTTSNAGALWTLVPFANIPLPLTNEFAYVSLYETVGDAMWFGTSTGRIYKSIDKGLNWTVTQSPLLDFAGQNGVPSGN